MSRGILLVGALLLMAGCAGFAAKEGPVTPNDVVTTPPGVVMTTSTTLETKPSPIVTPYLDEETGVLLLLDDGIDGLTAVDLDRRLAARSVVEGQRAGDEQYSMVKVGDRLVVGWGEPHSVDLTTRSGMSLGAATTFVPAAEPDSVWMVDYPGGRIGMGDPHIWRVDVVSGERLTEPKQISRNAYPDIGIAGGLALQTDTGFSLWNAETSEITPLDSDGPGFSMDVQGNELVWCASDCGRLFVTDTSRMETHMFGPPSGHDRFVAAKLSPDGQNLAAIVSEAGTSGGGGLWILDLISNEESVVVEPDTHADRLAWASDGDQLFATSYSYGEDSTAVWRYQPAEGELKSAVLPFGGAISLVVVDGSLADAYIGDVPGDADQCPAPHGQPSGRSDICTFDF